MSGVDEYPVHDDCEQVHLPPRSPFYRLEPRGLGTARRESLSSYIMRLAHEHCVSPTSLAQLMMLSSPSNVDEGSWAFPFIGGVGSAAQNWSGILADMTGNPTLEPLTLLSLRAIVSTTGVMAKWRRWCPECLRCKDEMDVPHGHLIWEISAADACPEHGLVLVHTCRCGQRRSKWRVKRLPHLCEYCGGLLWKTSPRQKANGEQVRIAKIVANFLADPNFDKGTWRDLVTGPAKFLEHAARLHAGGHRARLANMLGISKGSMHGWCRASHRPTLKRLVLLADLFGCSLADLLYGRADATHPPTGHLPRGRRPGPGSARSIRLVAKLRSLSNQVPPMPLAAIARELGITTKALRNNHPELARGIVARHAALLSRRRKEREREIVEGVATLVTDGQISDRREFNRLRQLARFARVEELVAQGKRLARKRTRKVQPLLPLARC
jgi:transcriptional regulator with XRE-family HTH domain